MAYKLKLPDQWKIHDVFHMDLLSPYMETEEHSPNFEKPPPDLIEGEEEWEVSKILDTRIFGHKRKHQYLVSWTGYLQSENSWVSEADLNADDLLEEYKTRTNNPERRGRCKT